MTDRIDSYFEGTLDRTQLSAEERAEVEALKAVIRETRAFVDGQPAPDLSASVMRQIAHHAVEPAVKPTAAFAQFLATLWTARQVSFYFRPAYGLLAAAAVVAVTTFWPPAWRPIWSAPAASLDTPQLFVQFRLQAPDASSVRLAGTFTNWQPQYELRRTLPGVWTITIPLAPGVHDYAFVVDGGQWIPDPYAQSVKDGFGGTNSRIALVAPPDSRL